MHEQIKGGMRYEGSATKRGPKEEKKAVGILFENGRLFRACRAVNAVILKGELRKAERPENQSQWATDIPSVWNVL